VHDPAFCGSSRQLGASCFHWFSWFKESELLKTEALKRVCRRGHRAAVLYRDVALRVIGFVSHVATIECS
jgi:hypothetical protein